MCLSLLFPLTLIRFSPLLINLSIPFLRVPPILFSRKLINSIGFRVGINPLPINNYCASVRYRSADSEAPYLEELRDAIFALRSDDATLVSIGNILPQGGIDSPSILQSLHDALAFRGPPRVASDIANRAPEHQWLLSYPFSSMPSCYKGTRLAVRKILSIDESSIPDLNIVLARESVVTLGPDICGSVVPQHDWFHNLEELLKSVNSFLRVCWLKAIGAWTTTVRMHESVIWPCIFGCVDCKD